MQATLNNLDVNYKLVHGGYFAEDTDKSEGSEFRKILVDKEDTLNIYNKDKSFNTFRFIFSKWTLKESWDNPNAFTIVKLRGSGSENSELQEVGRGLRLSITIIHKVISKFIAEKYPDGNYNLLFREIINKILISKIVSLKHSLIQGLFEYQSINTTKKSTKLTDENGNMLDSVNSIDIGNMEYKGKAIIIGNYLYDKIMYDSLLELENINTIYGDKVEVYGKIPKNSIRIPKIDGATCSPNFMYVLKDTNGNTKKMNLVIESKKYRC